MTTVERLEELKTVDIKEIERDSLPKYKDCLLYTSPSPRD